MARNDLGYVVLDKPVLEQLMGPVPDQELDPFSEELIVAELEKYGIPAGNKQTGSEFAPKPGQLALPKLLGNNIAEHYEAMAKELLKPYWQAIWRLQREAPCRIPDKAMLVAHCQPGWTRFEPIGTSDFEISYPDTPCEQELVYDTETFVQGSPFAMPVIATAINGTASYVWLSPQLVKGEFDRYTAPLPRIGNNKWVVCHNVAYDASRYEERYQLHNPAGILNFDTMSAQQVVAGLDASQRWAWNARHKQTNLPRFLQFGSGKSLIDSWNFHVGKPKGRPLLSHEDKMTRAHFVIAKNMQELRDVLPELLEYALDDVVYTHELYSELLPKFMYMCPSPVVLSAHAIMAGTVLPVADDWHDWCQHVENAYHALNNKRSQLFIDIANKWHKAWQDGELDPGQDAWLSQLNWHIVGQETCTNKPVAQWFAACGGGQWLTGKKKDAHYLLKLTWNGQPIRQIKGMGWCWQDASGEWQRVPHKKGNWANVGCVLTADYLRYIDDGILASDESAGDAARQIIMCQQQTSYWISIRDRTVARPVRQAFNPATGGRCYVLAPLVVPANTVSLRTGEALLLTLASHTAPKLGAEIKAKTRAPLNYKIFSMDWDSQELQILGAYSDSYTKISGSNAFSFSLLVGDKKLGTDTHTLVAKQANVCRDAGKQSVYAICYGGGSPTVATTICLWHPEYDREKATEFARKVISAFKGYKPRGQTRFVGGQASQAFNKMFDLLVQDEPATPLLGTKMAPAMWPANSGDLGKPAQLNWQVQSAGASMLHCMVVACTWLAKRLKIPADLAFTFHDEVVFYAPKQYELLWPYCMQIAHAWGWSLLHYKLGIYDMPAIRAWASGINVDMTWRKSPIASTETPTHPNLPPGKEYSMSRLVELGAPSQFQKLWQYEFA